MCSSLFAGAARGIDSASDRAQREWKIIDPTDGGRNVLIGRTPVQNRYSESTGDLILRAYFGQYWSRRFNGNLAAEDVATYFIRMGTAKIHFYIPTILIKRTAAAAVSLFSAVPLLVLLFPVPLFSQDDIRPWERLGLSTTEWKLIQDNNMPMSKVEKLLRDGIGITEYFDKPWEALGMSESKWMAKRRSGLTNYDIELQNANPESDSSINHSPSKNITFVKHDYSPETSEKFAALFLPGFVQCRKGRKVPGRIMVSLAIGSAAGTIVWSAAEKRFYPLPIMVILIPDMGWSFIDHLIQKNSGTE